MTPCTCTPYPVLQSSSSHIGHLIPRVLVDGFSSSTIFWDAYPVSLTSRRNYSVKCRSRCEPFRAITKLKSINIVIKWNLNDRTKVKTEQAKAETFERRAKAEISVEDAKVKTEQAKADAFERRAKAEIRVEEARIQSTASNLAIAFSSVQQDLSPETKKEVYSSLASMGKDYSNRKSRPSSQDMSILTSQLFTSAASFPTMTPAVSSQSLTPVFPSRPTVTPAAFGPAVTPFSSIGHVPEAAAGTPKLSSRKRDRDGLENNNGFPGGIPSNAHGSPSVARSPAAIAPSIGRVPQATAPPDLSGRGQEQTEVENKNEFPRGMFSKPAYGYSTVGCLVVKNNNHLDVDSFPSSAAVNAAIAGDILVHMRPNKKPACTPTKKDKPRTNMPYECNCKGCYVCVRLVKPEGAVPKDGYCYFLIQMNGKPHRKHADGCFEVKESNAYEDYSK